MLQINYSLVEVYVNFPLNTPSAKVHLKSLFLREGNHLQYDNIFDNPLTHHLGCFPWSVHFLASE